jgi:hypothetical protein
MEKLSTTEVLLTAMFSLFVFIDIAGNTLVCLVILKKRFKIHFCQGKTAMDYLLVNLAISDILFAVFVVPRYVLNHAFNHPTGLNGDFLCKFLTGGVLIWVGGAASVFSLLLIALDRYCAVVHPHRHGRRISTAKLPFLLSSCWVFTILLNLPLFLVMKYDETKDFCVERWPENFLPKAYGILWLLYGGLLPIPIMAFLYIRIIRALWFARPRSSSTSSQSNHLSAAQLSKRKATKLCITVTGIYTICWMPILVLYIISFHFPTYVEYGSITYKASVAMTCLNSSINPFVYTLQSNRFRKCVKDLLCGFCR